MTEKNIEIKIEAAMHKLSQLRALKQKIDAQKRTTESKKKRSEDTRRKILVGAAVLAKVDRGEWTESRLLELLGNTLTRSDDRALFNLYPIQSADENSHQNMVADSSIANIGFMKK
ncbi:mobilization protein [Undibacterium jejuense]|uniref:Mobilization protein n=1 Tax=Undibacterium jejuense TaxID=1344949 RepID=A0A923HLQ3_9BURK|nr:mobilization protein [Undibacterium jejuense]MBC3863194.1 mobilization protein [Undibacterium jejuense]